MKLDRKPDVCQPNGTADLPMLDIFMPMMKSSAIVSAARLGLFEALAKGPLTAADLALRLEADASAVATLADFLVALGYLTLEAGALGNTPSTHRWLTSAGTVDYTAGALWTHEAWSMMNDLPEVVRRGVPAQTLWRRMVAEPQLGPLFSRYMQAFAQDLGPDLIERVTVAPQHRELLDLGGSHGLHSMRFCRHHPQMNATIVDMPSALTDTAASIEQAGLSQRINLRPGNLLDLDWVEAQRYDIVLYLSVGHNQVAADNARVLGEIYRCLRPGGILVIHDYLAGTPLDAFNAAFRLTLLLETGTRTYSHGEYSAWLQSAGFAAVERIDLNPLEKGSLLIARR